MTTNEFSLAQTAVNEGGFGQTLGQGHAGNVDWVHMQQVPQLPQ